MYLGNVRARRWLTDDVLATANAFYRYYRRRTSNGDVGLDCVDSVSGAAAFNPGGRAVGTAQCQGSASGFVDQNGQPLAGDLEREPDGQARQTTTTTQDWGTTLQLSYRGKVLGRGNQVTVGVAYDGHRTNFAQSEADADLVPDGNSVGVTPAGPFETDVGVRTTQQDVGVYFVDTLDVTNWLSLTLGGRYQSVNIQIRDQTGQNPNVNGNHTFDRFSPSVGATVRALPNLTLFGAYNEGFRAPTAAELTCADPKDPCNLPNAFIADPSLKPVVAHTYEFGARGTLPIGDTLRWSLAFFRTNVDDDILFVQTESTGAGFFQNVAKTRRQGVEAGFQGAAWKRLQYYLSYAFIDATYETSTTLASVTVANGVPVKPGDKIPGIPAQNLKFGAQVAVLDNLWVGADVVSVSGSYLRGDDNNQQPKLSPYTLLNLNLRYAPVKFLEIWGRVSNVTNARYATAGALNWNAFADPISVQRFVAPGAPIGGWAGVKVHF
jgi:outer membrane receptor protein involved in Fe transport